MGAGRKTHTYTLKERSQPSSSVNCSLSARNLRKPELGGVIFGCKHSTIGECISQLLFGLPAGHMSYIKNIGPGLPLFLFNYSDRKLHGVFEAASEGRMNINPYAWTEDGSECTPFPAQVKIRIRMLCQPLSEDQYGPVIADNYYLSRHFWFELDQHQATKLISMFSSLPVAANSTILKSTAKSDTVFKGTCLSNSWKKGGRTVGPTSDVNRANQEQGKIGGGSCGGDIDLSGQSKSLECEDYVAEQEHKITVAEQEHNITKVILNRGHSCSSIVHNIDHSIMHSEQDHTEQSSLDTHGLNEENRSLGKLYNDEAIGQCMKISKGQRSFLPAMGKMCTSHAHSDVNCALKDSCSDVGRHLLDIIVNNKVANDHEHRVVQTTENCLQSYCSIEEDQSSFCPRRKWNDLYKNSITCTDKVEDKEIETLDSEQNLPTLDQVNGTCAPCNSPGVDGEGNSWQDCIDEYGQHCEQFDCLKQQIKTLSVSTDSDPCVLQNSTCKSLSAAYSRWGGRQLGRKALEGNSSWLDRSEIEDRCLSEAELSDVKSTGHHFIVDKILLEVNKLKLNQFKQDQKISSLEEELVESRREIKNLKQQLKTLEGCTSRQETCLVMESESSSNKSIIILGGFDGLSFLSSLDCYSLSRDSLKSLCPMSAKRSYTSAVKYNGEIYVIGGGCHDMWYDTVESYNLMNNQWITRPSLNQMKGGLAGISLNEKIFAIGGGNGVQCFSEVELFDIDLGRWIPTQPMLHKRFAPAAAEISGTIYVVGGYDGNGYLGSMERFDPREHSWKRLESMSTKRGCHSLAVLNEKLYAIGGYDGEQMVPTIEVFDPRMGYWTKGEPMNICRGYHAAIVIGNSIFVIGGLAKDNSVIDKVECYTEAHGWQSTNLKALGKRCFFSAILI